MIRAVSAAAAAVLIAVVISLVTSGPSSSHGCIYATIPAATGAQQINECGATARATCASLASPGAFTAQAAPTVAAACRKAGLPTTR